MSRFRRQLPQPPERPDLAQQKKLAKDLLSAHQSGDQEARERISAELPDKKRIVLADAQFVLAREYGFASWNALREHIERDAERAGPPLERFREALKTRDVGSARRILETHPEVRSHLDDPVFSFDAPAITSFSDDPAIVALLLEFGADPNRRSDWWAGGFHALYGATEKTAALLLRAGAVPDACAAAHLDRPDLLTRMLADDPGRVHERGGDGQTPLHFARSRRVVDLLLDAGADIDARDVDHRATAAEWMLEQRRGAGRYELSRYLVERGASADIFLAAAHGLTDRVRALLEADPSLLERRTGEGEYAEKPPSSYHIYMWTLGGALTPMDAAAHFEQHETLDVMRGFARPVQQFVLAAQSGNAPAARALLRADPSLMSRLEPAHHRALAAAAWRGDAAGVALMLELGFDPRVPGHDSGTALHCAAWEGSADSVAALLRHPDAPELVQVKDAHYGATPLGWCCHGSIHGNRRREHARVARLLLEAGATSPEAAHASPAVEKVLSDWTG